MTVEKMPVISCPDCVAFGKHCPHTVKSPHYNPYTYSCELTVQALEKENAELKEISEMNSLSKVLIQRCKEVGIKDLYHLANYLTIIENQKYQIEKMKCCRNCKYDGSGSEIGENGDYTDYICIQCDDFSTKENPYPNWELTK